MGVLMLTSWSLMSAMMLANDGELAEVPPTSPETPALTTWKFQPWSATCRNMRQYMVGREGEGPRTSGYPRPLRLNVPAKLDGTVLRNCGTTVSWKDGRVKSRWVEAGRGGPRRGEGRWIGAYAGALARLRHPAHG